MYTTKDEGPTDATYTALRQAFDHFNAALFDGALPPCLITVARKGQTYGYFWSDKFAAYDGDARADEIALNPDHFKRRTTSQILSTLVHEMVHQWRQRTGKPPRGGYHDRQWADKMESLGLIPSSTGEAGGKRTGQRVSHYIAFGGPFEAACDALLASGFTLPYYSFPAEAKAGRAGKRVKYVCPDCSAAAWAKPDSLLLCGVPDCGASQMQPQGKDS